MKELKKLNERRQMLSKVEKILCILFYIALIIIAYKQF